MVDNIEVLDCTLRDGGHVNNAEFGRGNILKIETALVKSKVDIIELEDISLNRALDDGIEGQTGGTKFMYV